MYDNNTVTLEKAIRGDADALDLMIRENAGLVHSIARRFLGRGCDYDDLVQIGNIGLIKAVRRFDSSHNVRFSTYAVPLIMGEIKRFLRDDGLVKVSRRCKEIHMTAAKAARDLSAQLMREPTVNEIAEKTGIDSEDIAIAIEACSPCDSIYRKVCEGDSRDVYLIDTVSDSDAEGKMLDGVSLRLALDRLDEREKKIVAIRYFSGKTQSETAQKLGISQVQISRLEKKILAKLRKNLEDEM